VPKKTKTKTSKTIEAVRDADPRKPGGSLKLFGLLLILAAVVCFLVNFDILHLWLLDKLTWLWNPLSLLTTKLVGHTWLISSALAWMLNGIFALIWSIALFIIGLQLLLH
jgi:hypothetical protein